MNVTPGQDDSYRDFPELAGLDLRNDLAEIILRNLDRNNWKFADLARALKIKPPNITRMVRSEEDCKLSTVGRYLVALGLARRVRLVDLELYEEDRAKFAHQAALKNAGELKFFGDVDNGKKQKTGPKTNNGTGHVIGGIRLPARAARPHPVRAGENKPQDRPQLIADTGERRIADSLRRGDARISKAG